MDKVTSLSVIQHTSAEYLGLIEDHLEGRRIKFRYHRPFTERGGIPRNQDVGDGVILLGGGPWGSAGPNNVPTLVREVELAAHCLAHEIPLIGIGLGAQIVALAAGGKTHASELSFSSEAVSRVTADALGGYLPESFTQVVYMRDQIELAENARVLAKTAADAPAVFQIGPRALGFIGHPGFKVAIAEDLIMEFEHSPEAPSETLAELRRLMPALEDSLVPLMTGVVKLMGWMD